MKFDLFYFWRWILVLVCTVYWGLCLAQTMWGWYQYLWSDDRSAAMMRRYVFVQFMRMRVHRFSRELVQITVLLVLFVAITLAHRAV